MYIFGICEFQHNKDTKKVERRLTYIIMYYGVEGGIYVLLELEFVVCRPNDVDEEYIIMALT